MLRNKLIITGIIFSIAAVVYFYNTVTISAPGNVFIEGKKTFRLNNGTANVNLDLKNDAYSLWIHYSFEQNQEKEFFFNSLKINPLTTKIRGRYEVNYIYLPAEMIKNGQNLLTVRFLRNYPEAFAIRIRNYYYRICDSLYILAPDSVYLTGGKGVSINGLYKLVITKSLFWFLLLFSSFVASLFYFFKKKIINTGFHSLSIPFRNRKIKYIGNIILWGFISSVLFHWIKSIILGFYYPNNTFLFIPEHRFNDFFSIYEICRGLNPYFTTYFFPSNYYPFTNILAFFFTLLPKLESLILFSFIFVLSFLYVNVSNLTISDRAKSVKNILILTFLTYPFLFCIDRMNYENIMFIFLYLFIYFYNRKKFVISSIFLSFAIAMKAFPIVFLMLFLSDKKYKETILTIIFVILLTVSSLMFHKGGFFSNLNFMLSGFNYNDISYLCNSNNVVQRGVSLFTLVKMYFIQFNQIVSVDMLRFLGIYVKAVFLLLILFSGYVLFVEKELWKKVMILVSAALLLPHASADYKLIYIFIPMFMFINSDKKSRFDLFYIVMFGLLLIPKDYYQFPKIISDSACSDIGIAVVLNILIILAMMAVIIIDGFSNWLTQEKGNA